MLSPASAAPVEERLLPLSAPLAKPHGFPRSVAWMVATAFLLRLLVIFAFHTYEQQTRLLDSHSPAGIHFEFGYETGSIAASLAEGRGFSSPFGIESGPTAWIAPVYPAMCALVFKLFGIYSTASAIAILSLNSLFAALTCIPVYLIAIRVFDDRVAQLSGWAWATFPFFMRWPTTWIWEVSLSALLMACLALLSLEAAERDGQNTWLLLGLTWGFAAITSPSVLAAMPVSLLWIAWQRRRTSRPYARSVILVIAICFAVMLPWLVRNRIRMGHYVFVRDNFGFEFYLGNYHGSNGVGFAGKHPTVNRIQMNYFSQVGEVAYVKHFQREALQFVREYPQEFFQLTIERFVSFWDGSTLNLERREPWSWQPWEVLFLTVAAGFGLVLACFVRKTGATLLAVIVLLYPLPYYMVYASSRYRHVIEPELLIFSCFFACALWDHMRVRFALPRNIRIEEQS